MNEVLNSRSNYNPKGRFGSKGTFWQQRGILAAKGLFWQQEMKEGTIINISIIYATSPRGAQSSGMGDGVSPSGPYIYAKRGAQNFFWHGAGRGVPQWCPY